MGVDGARGPCMGGAGPCAVKSKGDYCMLKSSVFWIMVRLTAKHTKENITFSKFLWRSVISKTTTANFRFLFVSVRLTSMDHPGGRLNLTHLNDMSFIMRRTRLIRALNPPG